MKTSRVLMIAVVGLCAGLGVRLWLVQSDTTHPKSSVDVVSIVPLATANSQGVSPMQEVELRYSIRNLSPQSLDGLQLELSCGCQIRRALPASLAPDESAEFAFVMRAPELGVLQRTISVRASGHEQPVGTIPVSLEVPANAPRLLRLSPSIVIDWVRGAAPTAMVQFEAIEVTASAPWLTTLEVEGADGLTVADWTHSDRVGSDRSVCLRVYRGVLSWTSMPQGGRTAQLRLKRSTSTVEDEPTVPLSIRALDRLAAFPATIRFMADGGRADSGSAVVTLVDRLHGRTLTPREYDAERLSVKPLDTSRQNSFVVSPRGDAQPATEEIRVAFATEDGETIHVPVMLATASTNSSGALPASKSDAP